MADLLELMEIENGGDPGMAEKFRGFVASADRELSRQMRIVTSNPFTHGEWAEHRKAVAASIRINIVRSILVAACLGWSDGTIPPYLRGFRSRKQADVLGRIIEKQEDRKSWRWTWEYVSRVHLLLDFGIRSESDFDAAREWVKAARINHTHPEVRRYSESAKARAKRIYA